MLFRLKIAILSSERPVCKEFGLHCWISRSCPVVVFSCTSLQICSLLRLGFIDGILYKCSRCHEILRMFLSMKPVYRLVFSISETGFYFFSGSAIRLNDIYYHPQRTLLICMREKKPKNSSHWSPFHRGRELQRWGQFILDAFDARASYDEG